MPKSFSLAGILCIAIASVSCSDAAAPPDLKPGPPPTKIVITDVAVENVAGGAYQVVRVGLRNDGGPGTYYVLFRRNPAIPGGVGAAQQTEPVDAPTGFKQSRLFDEFDIGEPDIVMVFARAANSSSFIQTDCKPLHAGVDCSGFWDY